VNSVIRVLNRLGLAADLTLLGTLLQGFSVELGVSLRNCVKTTLLNLDLLMEFPLTIPLDLRPVMTGQGEIHAFC